MLSMYLNFSFPRMKTAYFSQSKYSKSKQEKGLVKQMLDIVKGSIMHQWIQFTEERASVLDKVSLPHKALKHMLTEWIKQSASQKSLPKGNLIHSYRN